jgi:hypothetical protein
MQLKKLLCLRTASRDVIIIRSAVCCAVELVRQLLVHRVHTMHERLSFLRFNLKLSDNCLDFDDQGQSSTSNQQALVFLNQQG